jgi:hypothetical protein
MKSAFWKLVLILTLCLIAVGFYRGWFALSSKTSDAPTNKVDVNLTVDRDKVNKDAQSVKEKTTTLTGEVTEEAKKLEKQVTSRSRTGSSSSK